MEQHDGLNFYKEHPKTCAPDDFWSQVKRSVHGRPVGEEQIQLIVDALRDGLRIGKDDVLLDLGCGNGALTDRIFAFCRGGLGVDFSPALIDIARRYFYAPPARDYRLEDVEQYCRTSTDTARFTKALCYSALQYMPKQKAENVLTLVSRRFPNVERFFIGEMPDKAKMAVFYGDRVVAAGIEDDPGAAIGVWRTQEEMAALAQRCGWRAEFRKMPSRFYAAAYRYDALLTRSAVSGPESQNA